MDDDMSMSMSINWIMEEWWKEPLCVHW